MARIVIHLSVVLAVVLFGAGLPQIALGASELGIITGGEKGTYYQFGLNLQALATQAGDKR